MECLKLQVHDEQKTFVATNVWSLAQAYVSVANGGHASPFALYASFGFRETGVIADGEMIAELIL